MRILKFYSLPMLLILLTGCSGKKDFNQMTFCGTMEMTEHVLGIKTTGRLEKLFVKEGDMVKKGQLLATFDRYEQNKRDLARLRVLYKNGGANKQSLENAFLGMQDQRIVSPLDGIVLIKSAEIGEIVSAGGGVVVIGNPQDKWVKIFISEELMHQLSLNQAAAISVDGSKKIYKGHVSFIADKAQFTPRNVQTPEERITQTFAVKIIVDDADDNLHPGVAADVKFE